MHAMLPNQRSPETTTPCVVQWAPQGQHLRLPCAHMVCNQTPPIGDKPSLMTFREVETLFHEFGHALQHMLTTEEEGLVSGIRGVEWDAVELPSQFMENWCYDFPTLMSFAKHYETGEPLPKDLFDKLKAARCVPVRLLRVLRPAAELYRRAQHMQDVQGGHHDAAPAALFAPRPRAAQPL